VFVLRRNAVQPCPHVTGQRNGTGIAQNFNRLARLIHDHGAVFAVREMALKLLLHHGIEIAVDVVRNLADDAFAVQFSAPCRKWRISFSLSFNRARSKRDFTAEIEMPSASAVSCVDSSSTSRQDEHDSVLILQLFYELGDDIVYFGLGVELFRIGAVALPRECSPKCDRVRFVQPDRGFCDLRHPRRDCGDARDQQLFRGVFLPAK
jgi:hypothetical protein